MIKHFVFEKVLGEFPAQESLWTICPNQFPPQLIPLWWITRGIDRGELTSAEYDRGELAEGNSPGAIPKMAVSQSIDVKGFNSQTFLLKAIIWVFKSSYLAKLLKKYNT